MFVGPSVPFSISPERKFIETSNLEKIFRLTRVTGVYIFGQKGQRSKQHGPTEFMESATEETKDVNINKNVTEFEGETALCNNNPCSYTITRSHNYSSAGHGLSQSRFVRQSTTILR